MDSALRGGSYIGGGGDGRDEYGFSRWNDNLAHVTLGAEPTNLLAYDPVLKLHQQIMSTLGDPRGRLEKERNYL